MGKNKKTAIIATSLVATVSLFAVLGFSNSATKDSTSYSSESNINTAQIYQEEPKEEIWHCKDATSYDKNPYNDNYCENEDGVGVYVPDSEAEELDKDYNASKKGGKYYNNF